MKKIILVYIVLIVAFIFLAVLGFGRNLPSFIPNIGGGNSSPEASARIGDQTVELLLADSDEERIKGLSGRENLPENQGMLFTFEERGEYGFWMKDMKFPIDIIFIDDNTVINLYKNVQPGVDPNNLTIYEPDKPVNRVLELNANKSDELGIEPGGEITFEGL